MGNSILKELREQFLTERSRLNGERLSLTFSACLNHDVKTPNRCPGNCVMKLDVLNELNGNVVPVLVYLRDPQTTDSEPVDDAEVTFLDLCSQAGELIPPGQVAKLDEWISEFSANAVGRSYARWIALLFDCQKSMPAGNQWSHCAFTIEDVFRVSSEALGALSQRIRKAGQSRSRPRRRKKSQIGGDALTPHQLEVCRIVNEYEGNVSKAAQQLGRDESTVRESYQAAQKKLGKLAIPKPRTKTVPKDKHGNVNLSEVDDERRHQI